MKKLLLASALLFTTSISYATQPAWQGAYLGLTAGGAWGSAHPIISTNADGYLSAAGAATVNQAGDQSIQANGFTPGIEAGYNWFFNRYFVGLAADVESIKLSDSGQSNAINYPDDPANNFVTSSYVNINWLATLRPRIGIAFNNGLFYLTGGLAVTKLHANFYFTDTNDVLASGSINDTQTGYTIGCGAEVGLTKNWSMKLEYLYMYFNRTNASETSNSIAAFFPNQQFNYSTNLNTNILRVGLNYNFG